jgi:hypothetical protein
MKENGLRSCGQRVVFENEPELFQRGHSLRSEEEQKARGVRLLATSANHVRETGASVAFNTHCDLTTVTTTHHPLLLLLFTEMGWFPYAPCRPAALRTR